MNITEQARGEFEAEWANVAGRPYLCNAKDLLAGLNRWLQAEGHKTLSARALSDVLTAPEIDRELAGVIEEAEQLAAGMLT